MGDETDEFVQVSTSMIRESLPKLNLKTRLDFFHHLGVQCELGKDYKYVDVKHGRTTYKELFVHASRLASLGIVNTKNDRAQKVSEDDVRWRLLDTGLAPLAADDDPPVTDGSSSDVAQKVAGDTPAARIEVACPCGKVDVVCDDLKTIIEVKDMDRWMYGLGQLQAYGLFFPGYKKRLHLFKTESSSGGVRKLLLIQKVCQIYDIDVTVDEDSIRLH
eukprot:jgi/Mesvir1/17764/Mv19001-RA.1